MERTLTLTTDERGIQQVPAYLPSNYAVASVEPDPYGDDHAVRLPPQLDLFRNANPVPHPPTIGFGDGDRWPVALTGWEQSDLRRQFDNADRALRDVIERCASALRDLHGRPDYGGSVTGLGNAAHSLIDAAAAVAALGKASDAAEHRHWTAGQPTCVDPATGTQYVGGDELPPTPDEGAAADGD